MSLGYYESLASDHWKEFLPKMYVQALKEGKLAHMLTRAAEQTDREMQNALDSGIPRDQAWEGVRGRYLLLEPESDNDDEYGPNPNQPFYDLAKEINDATQKIYDEM